MGRKSWFSSGEQVFLRLLSEGRLLSEKLVSFEEQRGQQSCGQKRLQNFLHGGTWRAVSKTFAQHSVTRRAERFQKLWRSTMLRGIGVFLRVSEVFALCKNTILLERPRDLGKTSCEQTRFPGTERRVAEVKISHTKFPFPFVLFFRPRRGLILNIASQVFFSGAPISSPFWGGRVRRMETPRCFFAETAEADPIVIADLQRSESRLLSVVLS